MISGTKLSEHKFIHFQTDESEMVKLLLTQNSFHQNINDLDSPDPVQ